MNNLEKRFIQNTRVFFGSIASMLLIYVPNVYFQLLDCGAEHTPSLGLSLRGFLFFIHFYNLILFYLRKLSS